MKIFAIYFRLNLIEKPEWFDGFRQKYDKAYDPHITMIQPRYIDEKEIDTIKSMLNKFLSEHRLGKEDGVISFDKLVRHHKAGGSQTLMLEAKKVKMLSVFQKKMRETFLKFGSYAEEEREQYEINFKPHITIGRDIPAASLKEIELYFQSDYSVKGILGDLVLTIVRDRSIEEAMDPKNLTIINAF